MLDEDTRLRPDQDVADTYLAVLLRAVIELPDSNQRTRRVIYIQAEEAQRIAFEQLDPPASDEDVEYEYRLFRQTVRLLEEDIRNEVDIRAPYYRPHGLDVLHGKLVRARDIKRARKLAVAGPGEAGPDEQLSREQASALDRLQAALDFVDLGMFHTGPATGRPGAFRVLQALLINQFQVLEGTSRFAVAWMLIQPALLLALISTIYFLTGANYVLDMDVPTFAVLGAGTWIMCRQIILRVSTGYAHHRVLINLPTVTPLTFALSQMLLFQIIYAVSLAILIGLGTTIDLATWPKNLTGVVIYFCGMSAFALSVGIIFGLVGVRFPFFLRLAPVIERAMQMFSSVYFVSEQLPSAYKPYLLLSPTAHGMQLLRAHYFGTYTAPDASPAYFWLGITALVSVTLVAERLLRSNLQPI